MLISTFASAKILTSLSGVGPYALRASLNVLCSYSRCSGPFTPAGICTSNLCYPEMSSDKRDMNVHVLYDIILDKKPDFLCHCETWHHPSDCLNTISLIISSIYCMFGENEMQTNTGIARCPAGVCIRAYSV